MPPSASPRTFWLDEAEKCGRNAMATPRSTRTGSSFGVSPGGEKPYAGRCRVWPWLHSTGDSGPERVGVPSWTA